MKKCNHTCFPYIHFLLLLLFTFAISACSSTSNNNESDMTVSPVNDIIEENEALPNENEYNNLQDNTNDELNDLNRNDYKEDNCGELLSIDRAFEALKSGDFSIIDGIDEDYYNLFSDYYNTGISMNEHQMVLFDANMDGEDEIYWIKRISELRYGEIIAVFRMVNGRVQCIYKDLADNTEYQILSNSGAIVYVSWDIGVDLYYSLIQYEYKDDYTLQRIKQYVLSVETEEDSINNKKVTFEKGDYIDDELVGCSIIKDSDWMKEVSELLGADFSCIVPDFVSGFDNEDTE